MDPSHVVVVPDAQLPDENYIERLFPKCPPKQQQQQQRNVTFGSDKRPSRKSNENTHQRRQMRSKAQQQQSRRELEARRNKQIKSSSSSLSLKDNNANNNGNSSESSDDNGTTRRVSISRRSSSGAATSTQQTTSATATITGSAPQRRSCKYTASQSLLKQLYRSQSSCSSNSTATNITTTTSEQHSEPGAGTRNNNNSNSTDVISRTGSNRGPSLAAGSSGLDEHRTSTITGIVKSTSSSYPFVTNDHQSCSSITTSISDASSQYRHHTSQTTMPTTTTTTTTAAQKGQHLVYGEHGRQAVTTTTSAATKNKTNDGKNDNNESDLLLCDTNEYSSNSESRSILKSSSKKETSYASNHHQIAYQSPAAAGSGYSAATVDNSASNNGRQVSFSYGERGSSSPPPQPPEPVKCSSSSVGRIGNRRNSREKMLADAEKARSVATASATTIAAATTLASACGGSGQPSRTADLGFGEKLDNNISNSIQRKEPSVTPELISIEDPTGDQIARPPQQQPLNNPDKASSSLDEFIGSKRQDSHAVDVVSNDFGSRKADDDSKYINLFVYDNNSSTHHQQRVQLISPEKQQQQQQQQYHYQQQQQQGQYAYAKAADDRYRPRGGIQRFNSSRTSIASSDKLPNEESFESHLKDNFEGTEVIFGEDKEASGITITNNNLSFETRSPTGSIIQTDSRTTANESHKSNLTKFSQAFDKTNPPNIISIHHQASQQLLSPDTNDNDDDNIVRNDASTEELCNIGDSIDETTGNRELSTGAAKKTRESVNLVIHRLDSEGTTSFTSSNSSGSSSTNSKLPSHGCPFSAGGAAVVGVGILQTVDEKAEINIAASFDQDLDGDKIELHERVSNDTVAATTTTTTMPASPPNLTKKGFIPPGYPQRIKPQATTGDATQTHIGGPSAIQAVGRESKPSNISSPPPPLLEELFLDDVSGALSLIDEETQSVRSNKGATTDDSLVSIKDNLEQQHGRKISSQQNLTSDKIMTTPTVLHSVSNNRRSNEHPRQMPSISEVQYELEQEAARNDLVDPIEQDLSSGVNKISLNNTYGDEVTRNEAGYRNEYSGGFQPQVQSTAAAATREKSGNFYPVAAAAVAAPVSESQDLQLHSSESKTSPSLETTTAIPNLRHHKLPNETSHYSIVRTSGSNVVGSSGNNHTNTDISAPSRSSSIQFNTLSDGESGSDESSHSSFAVRGSTTGAASNSRGYTVPKKSDASSIGSSGGALITPSSNIINHKQQAQNIDDDMMPTTKTALIFPRLDEGLSSEAESCDDEVEDDDERAMDADVDADDDDDEDDVDDDDVENDNLPLERNPTQATIQLGQSNNLDCFMRQPQQAKPQNRLISSLQQQQQPQQQSSLVDMTQDQSELHQVKAPAYGGYANTNPEPLEQNDLKSMSNYSSQNGQSNYWMGASSQQQPCMSSQPSSSQQQQQQQQQHFNQRNHHNSSLAKNNSNSNNNSFSRDEAKSTNRLSSDTDNETDRLLGTQRSDQLKMTGNDVSGNNSTDLQPVSNALKQNTSSREGSTHSDCEGRSEKEDRIHQAEMAVHEVKFRNGESQMATEVQLFISTEKIMVLDDKHRKIMMDHSLRTISYIADIGDAIVLIVRKKSSARADVANELGRPISKISCHVFESSESHTITKSISQAFQVAYTELLKANGTGDTSSYLPKELDYQEVLNSQEMSTDELEMFARKENQREVIVPKEKGEILGLSIVESGWGSVLPTVVIANLKHDGPAYRCKRLSIGDQILSVNGISLVGLPLAECQEILRKTKNQTVARLSVVPCPITVEVKIKRPDTKYQLGFSVQNGVICSLLRGGIAERGGVRVGHRIMSINGTTVVGVPHEKIVTLLASSVGEIRMKTCLTSLYRLILGEENPVHF